LRLQRDQAVSFLRPAPFISHVKYFRMEPLKRRIMANALKTITASTLMLDMLHAVACMVMRSKKKYTREMTLQFTWHTQHWCIHEADYDGSYSPHIPKTHPSPNPTHRRESPATTQVIRPPQPNRPPSSLCARHVALHFSQMTHIAYPHAHIFNKFQPSDTTSPYPSSPNVVQAR
jgi:hypothetical protein